MNPDKDLRLYNDLAKSFSDYRLAIMRYNKQYPKEIKKNQDKLLKRLAKRLNIGVLL